jgi:surface protein
MFCDASSFIQDIGSWDVFRGTSMPFMVSMDKWDNFKVVDMSEVFVGTKILNTYNVSNVTNMNSLFENATSFKQDIGSWDVSNMTNMYAMFENETSFNQVFGSWDVSRVIQMSNMLYGATSFNQCIGSWDVSCVTRMTFMFSKATSFIIILGPVGPCVGENGRNSSFNGGS